MRHKLATYIRISTKFRNYHVEKSKYLGNSFNEFVRDVFNGVLKNEKNDLEEEVLELAIYEPIVVLEFFTSQRCSSCTPTEVLLEKTKKELKKKCSHFRISWIIETISGGKTHSVHLFIQKNNANTIKIWE